MVLIMLEIPAKLTHIVDGHFCSVDGYVVLEGRVVRAINENTIASKIPSPLELPLPIFFGHLNSYYVIYKSSNTGLHYAVDVRVFFSPDKSSEPLETSSAHLAEVMLSLSNILTLPVTSLKSIITLVREL